MAVLVTPGIVLRANPYRDHDKILTLLTPGQGCVEVLSRGCKRPKSPLMPCSDLFVCGEFTLFQGKEMALLTGCELEDNFYPIRLNADCFLYASYMVSLCRACVHPGEESAPVFTLLLKGLYTFAYDQGVNLRMTMAAFLLLLCDELGYRPRLKNCVRCGKLLTLDHGAAFDLEEGGLCCPACQRSGSPFLKREDIVWMCQVLRSRKLSQEVEGSPELFRTLSRYVEQCMDVHLKIVSMLP